MSGVAEVPAHVPRHLVVDLDYYRVPGGDDDHPAAWKRALHEGPDIVWTTANSGHWIITRADDMEYINAHPDPFSSDSIAVPPQHKPIKLLPSESNPPLHSQYRAVINPMFSPKAISQLEARIRQHAIELIESFAPRGECEFSTEFAGVLPIFVFMSLAALPLEERFFLRGLTEQAVRSKEIAERLAAFRRIDAYVATLVEQRRREPGDDLMTVVVQSKVFGRPLTDEEIYATCTSLLFGGLDTVASAMGFIARFLAQNPAHRRQLVAEPPLIPQAVNELLRRFGIALGGRLMSGDCEYKGVPFRRGDSVAMPLWLHGVDERRFPDPLSVDFRRPNAGQHATFTTGVHRCPGSFLARTELRIFLEEWLKRIPDFEIRPGAQARVHQGSVVSLNHLPLVWDAAARSAAPAAVRVS